LTDATIAAVATTVALATPTRTRFMTTAFRKIGRACR
jgi:hypothetical protein